MTTITNPGITSTEVVRAQLTGRRSDLRGNLFLACLVMCLVTALAVLVILLWQVVVSAFPVFRERGVDFLTSDLASSPDTAGISQALWGSVVIAAFVVVLAFPIGIAAGVYLEEYAKPGKLTRFIQINIRNLAGVPSVVYGILGLLVFVQAAEGFTGGRSVMAAGLTLSILVLPIIVITTAESVRAVPSGLREAGFGVGATRWETTRDHVIPFAAPGILTGTMLAVARALGEAAPLVLIGAITGRLAQRPDQGMMDRLQGNFTALPMTIYGWANEPNRPGAETGLTFAQLTSAAILVLVVVVLLINLVAILLRNRFEKKRELPSPWILLELTNRSDLP